MASSSSTGAVAAGLGASASSLFASFCCVGPLVVTLFGVNGAILASTFKPWRPHLLLFALAFLIFGFFRMRSSVVAREGAACDPRSFRRAKVLLWTSAGVWVGAAVVTAVTWW